jgi:hypothetical protein
LEDLLGGDLVDEGLGLFSGFACVLEHAMGGNGGEAFVDEADGYGFSVERGAEGIGELAHLFGGFAGGAVHVAGQADDKGVSFFFGEEREDSLHGWRLAGEGLRGAVGDGFERVREHPEFV